VPAAQVEAWEQAASLSPPPQQPVQRAGTEAASSAAQLLQLSGTPSVSASKIDAKGAGHRSAIGCAANRKKRKAAAAATDAARAAEATDLANANAKGAQQDRAAGGGQVATGAGGATGTALPGSPEQTEADAARGCPAKRSGSAVAVSGAALLQPSQAEEVQGGCTLSLGPPARNLTLLRIF
jgi:hypothetical protein